MGSRLHHYITTLVVIILAIVFGTFALALLLNSLNLNHISPINALLSGFESGYIVLFYFLAAITAAIFLAYRYISRSTKQLDEVIKASASLAYPDEDPIELPPALKNVQDELNLARESALRDRMIAQEAEQRKNNLVVYLAHDLKTPLTSVIGYLTLLRDEGAISEELRQKYLSIALSKSERLEDLINEFFDITRFNLSNIELEYSTVNFTRMLEQIAFEFQPMLTQKNLQIKIQAPQDFMFSCDANMIQRVLDNLLQNAIRYSFENSTVLLVLWQEGSQVTLRVQNSGNTIPPEKLGRIIIWSQISFIFLFGRA